MSKNKALVFAYHTVGYECLSTLLDHGFEIPLVITHEDSLTENIWFRSVRDLCLERKIPFITPSDLNDFELIEQLQSYQPDYLFSFYYRFMIPQQILEIAKIAALNMHGSLLPKYRGRVPINWAVLHGETKTGATLHVMEAKPDAGDIVHQKAINILPDETAYEVFNKVAIVAKTTLEEVIPDLLTGEFPKRPNRLQEGSYFGARKPEDGRIDWQKNAHEVHNLFRAVAPPYSGAFTEIAHKKYVIHQAMLASPPFRQNNQLLGLQVVDNRIYGFCGDDRAILVMQLVCDDQEVLPAELQQILLSTTKV
jgi:methionyl-tRNA formyltransferase